MFQNVKKKVKDKRKKLFKKHQQTPRNNFLKLYHKIRRLMKQKSRKYKRYIRKQIKKQLQTTANSLEQKISEKIGTNLLKALDDIS
jgi:hypothetical protein